MAKKTQKVKPKRKPGRPKLVIDYDKVEAYAARGLTKDEVARCIGMSPVTLYRRQIDDPRFEAAMMKGLATGIAAVAAKLLQAINLMNVPAITFFLERRAGWTKTTLMGSDPENPLPANVQNVNLTPDFIRQELEKIENEF